ncbi:MAG: peptide chain release factor N(5)-glutamine methyltransferase [Chitinophagaceae bacterium]|nr:peptide chain release factor N(5)-glutamine methyltransferase [Chitinophagaceae bacterium]
MTVAEAKKEINNAITHLYEQREITAITRLLLEKITGLTRLDQIIQKDVLIAESNLATLELAIAKLSKGTPIQYVLGEAWFYGFSFSVTEHTLIPRPETEELVAWVIADFEGSTSPLHLLDVGTGSGCIPITIAKKLPNIKTYGLDISTDALSIAKKNALSIGTDTKFLKVDFLDTAEWEILSSVDILISNPPYIAETEKVNMHKNVLDYEPHVALFVPDTDPLIFYKQILVFAEKKLYKGTSIYLELNEALGEETMTLFPSTHFETTLKRDMQGKQRMLRVIKK